MATNPLRHRFFPGEALGSTRPAAKARAPAVARDYCRNIEAYADRIRRSSDTGQIIAILDEALRDTHSLQSQKLAAEARRGAAAAERQIEQLRTELALVTGLLREDPLTGVLNRRGLASAFEQEAARAARSGSVVSLMRIAVDEFDRLGQGHGVAAGDQSLMHIAAVAADSIRPGDILARFAGHQFVVALPGAHLEEARLCAMRLQAALAARPLAWDGKRVALTFSAGVVEHVDGEILARSLARAEEALMAAKRAGRNRVKTGC